MMKILLINGPNLQLLGRREPAVYGTTTLASIVAGLRFSAAELGFELVDFQSNVEGELVGRIGDVLGDDSVAGLIVNPGAYTHTSIALRDALAAAGKPAIEVHLSNTARREEFRQRSYTAPVCLGSITGCGAYGYTLALLALNEHLKMSDSGPHVAGTSPKP